MLMIRRIHRATGKVNVIAIEELIGGDYKLDVIYDSTRSMYGEKQLKPKPKKKKDNNWMEHGLEL